jgi:hypothetical protein
VALVRELRCARWRAVAPWVLAVLAIVAAVVVLLAISAVYG